MRTLFLILQKDLQLFFADRRGALMTILTPVALAALMGMLFAPKDRAAVVDILVADQDQSVATQALVEAINGDDSLRVEAVDAAVARERVARGKASVALIIPPGAHEVLKPTALFTGERREVELLYDPSRAIEAGLAEGLITKIVMEQVGKGLGDPSLLKSSLRDTRAKVAAEIHAGNYTGPAHLLTFLDQGIAMAAEQEDGTTDGSFSLGPPLTIRKKKAVASGVSSDFNSFSHNFAGMLCMFLLFMAVDRAKGLLHEREQGSLQRLQAAPVRPALLLLGSSLGTLAIALFISAAVYGAGMLAFGVRVHGSWPGFVLILFSQAVFVAGVGMLLTGLGNSEAQIGNLGTFAVLILSFLGGAMIPTFVMPDWVQRAALAVPTSWATSGLAAMTWRGLPFTQALLPATVLLLAGLACTAMGIQRFRWE